MPWLLVSVAYRRKAALSREQPAGQSAGVSAAKLVRSNVYCIRFGALDAAFALDMIARETLSSRTESNTVMRRARRPSLKVQAACGESSTHNKTIPRTGSIQWATSGRQRLADSGLWIAE